MRPSFVLSLVAAFGGLISTSFAQNAAKGPPKQALVVGTVNAEVLAPNGFARGRKEIAKGVIFDIESETLAEVTGKVNGQTIRVSKQVVTLSEKQEALKPTVAGFKPGQLVILSAKYSLEGNQPRNVKTRLQKYLPENGMLTEPLVFTITDDLSTAAGNQKTIVISGQTSAFVIQDPRRPRNTVVITQTPTTAVQTSPNVLVVEYSFNGKKGRKVGTEGKTMTLP